MATKTERTRNTMTLNRNPALVSICFLAGLLVMVNPTTAKADGYYSDSDGLSMIINIASAYLIEDSLQRNIEDRRDRRHDARRYNERYDDRSFNARDLNGRGFNHNGFNASRNNGLRPSHRTAGRGVFNSRNSFTSQPIRGGDSRRTRIIENPYPDRRVTGVTLTGIDSNVVHVEDVVAYPRRQIISHRGYSLSIFHPERHINTRGFIDYISVQAKRKEYFTVTFHYG